MTFVGAKRKRTTTFEMKKMEEAVHYVCDNVTAQDRLGAVKLNKTLYYADMLHYAATGTSITGATYVKRFRGPVPTQVFAAIEQLEREGRLRVSHVSVFDAKKREFETAGETDTKVFERGELDRLNSAMRFVCDHTAPEISEISHHIAWRAADMGEVLPYETFLVTYLGDIDDSDISLAGHVLEDAAKEGRIYG